ncbi:MAG: VOC family protein [Catenulispora sp.]|nr:VOC family protein [Catenulispora sp.]
MTSPFVFMDLRTTDLEASREFYTRMFDWMVVDAPAGPAATIPLFGDAQQPWGGFTPLVENDERAPQWIPYVAVDDVDEAVSRAVALGATLLRPRVDLPPGSIAVIADPGGAAVALWQGAEVSR